MCAAYAPRVTLAYIFQAMSRMPQFTCATVKLPAAR